MAWCCEVGDGRSVRSKGCHSGSWRKAHLHPALCIRRLARDATQTARSGQRPSHAKIYWPTGLVPRLCRSVTALARTRREASRAKALLLMGIPLSSFAEAHPIIKRAESRRGFREAIDLPWDLGHRPRFDHLLGSCGTGLAQSKSLEGLDRPAAQRQSNDPSTNAGMTSSSYHQLKSRLLPTEAGKTVWIFQRRRPHGRDDANVFRSFNPGALSPNPSALKP